jgi:cellulose synthase/poly-beta-1,6-N-acetylglucosamine synthase-like glycosyltransferase
MFDFVDPAVGAAQDLRRAGVPKNAPTWAQLRLSRTQRTAFWTAAAGAAVSVAIAPQPTIAFLVGAAVLLSTVHLSLRAIAWTVGVAQAAPPPLARREQDLPLYSLIVPLSDEANMVGSLIDALSALNYPPDRLEVLLAVEADDHVTQRAIRDARMPSWMRMLVVPPGMPRTKPRACTYALGHAAGELVVVYDAEDRPEADQLRHAVATFDAGGPDVVCLQARLVPYNASDSFLTRLFALDYCQWFDGMLTGFQRLGLPVPLGGTSNHFRRAALVEAGGWDGYNVTEDADLGLRLWRLGRGVRTIDSTTYEEAPAALNTWIPQRTRWSRGYLQTFLVHARSPTTLGLPPLGPAGWFFLLAFVGGSVVFALVNPIFWTMAIYAAIAGSGPFDWAFGPAIGAVAWGSMVFGNACAMAMAALSPLRRGRWHLAPWALLSFAYWVLISFASYKAIAVFARDPFRWEKTPHGRAKQTEPP